MANNFKTKIFKYDNEIYKIYKYPSKVINIKKQRDGTWDFVSAKGIIRKKLEEIDPKKYSFDETAKSKYNTQSLGAKLFKLLP